MVAWVLAYRLVKGEEGPAGRLPGEEGKKNRIQSDPCFKDGLASSGSPSPVSRLASKLYYIYRLRRLFKQ